MRIANREFTPERGPYIVGVVNLSPESPNQDAIVEGSEGAVARARRLVDAGASIIDIGARSSHWASTPVSGELERARLVPALMDLKRAGFLVSVDTWDAGVVRAADTGADLINDSDGFQDPEVIEAVAASGLPVIIPFLNGPNPRELAPFNFDDPYSVMLPWFESALERAQRAGVRDVILDPGTGYAQQHLSTEEKEAFQRRIYPNLHRIKALGCPLFVALPRKASPEATLELARMIVANGTDFLRAHDPALAVEAMRLEGKWPRSEDGGG
jgi:dihydropteroate synthase